MAKVKKTKGAGEPWEINEKRFYLPGTTIVEDCAYCGCEMTLDLGDDYLSYPSVNEVQEHWFPECYECGHECYARDDYKQQSFKYLLSVDLMIAA